MERIGKYVIHKAAVTSGHARLVFCHDPDLQVPVAVKLFSPRHGEDGPMSPAQLMARFEQEARTLAAFDHPHIVGIKTLERLADGRPYFVMPYQAAHLPYEIGKDGAVAEDTPEADRPRRLPLARALAVLKQVSSGLAALHRRGMVHRAVKPSNILLTARENGQAKLADFNMIKLPERNAPLPENWCGCTDYCAPEQRENAAAVGPQADVYSLGVLAYRLVTGALPEPGSAPLILPGRHPEVLVTLVRQATDPDPAARPAHAAMFLQALGTVPAEALAKPKVQVVPLRRVPKREPVAAD